MDLRGKIKLIGADLDGTLLNDEKQLCAGAAETIEKAAAQGVHFVPVTGRPLQGVPDCVRTLGAIDYLICSNGAQIIDNQTGESIFSCSMTNEKSREIFSLLQRERCIFEPFADGVCYTEQKILDSYIGLFRGSPVEEYLLSTRVIVDSVEALFMQEEKCADEFFVSCESKAVREKITAALDKAGGVQYWFYDDRYIEITREGCDKGAALETLCRRLGIAVTETMAFGDGDNDVHLLNRAGVAVAMGNAFPSVKAAADIVADTNNNNGVCRLIEEALL